MDHPDFPSGLKMPKKKKAPSAPVSHPDFPSGLDLPKKKKKPGKPEPSKDSRKDSKHDSKSSSDRPPSGASLNVQSRVPSKEKTGKGPTLKSSFSSFLPTGSAYRYDDQRSLPPPADEWRGAPLTTRTSQDSGSSGRGRKLSLLTMRRPHTSSNKKSSSDPYSTTLANMQQAEQSTSGVYSQRPNISKLEIQQSRDSFVQQNVLPSPRSGYQPSFYSEKAPESPSWAPGRTRVDEPQGYEEPAHFMSGAQPGQPLGAYSQQHFSEHTARPSHEYTQRSSHDQHFAPQQDHNQQSSQEYLQGQVPGNGSLDQALAQLHASYAGITPDHPQWKQYKAQVQALQQQALQQPVYTPPVPPIPAIHQRDTSQSSNRQNSTSSSSAHSIPMQYDTPQASEAQDALRAYQALTTGMSRTTPEQSGARGATPNASHAQPPVLNRWATQSSVSSRSSTRSVNDSYHEALSQRPETASLRQPDTQRRRSVSPAPGDQRRYRSVSPMPPSMQANDPNQQGAHIYQRQPSHSHQLPSALHMQQGKRSGMQSDAQSMVPSYTLQGPQDDVSRPVSPMQSHPVSPIESRPVSPVDDTPWLATKLGHLKVDTTNVVSPQSPSQATHDEYGNPRLSFASGNDVSPLEPDEMSPLGEADDGASEYAAAGGGAAVAGGNGGGGGGTAGTGQGTTRQKQENERRAQELQRRWMASTGT